jgi:hypothetical protein
VNEADELMSLMSFLMVLSEIDWAELDDDELLGPDDEDDDG